MFLAAAAGTRLEARWWLAISLGLRQGEVLGLWWSDIDLDRGELRVVRQLARPQRRGTGRTEYTPLKSTRSARVLHLPPTLVDSLRRHGMRQLAEVHANFDWADRRLVFASVYGTPIDHRNDVRAFKAVLVRAGLRDLRLHDLRHTAATLLLSEGTHPRVVMEMLGHSQIALTMNTYSHVMPSVLREAYASLETALWSPDDRTQQ